MMGKLSVVVTLIKMGRHFTVESCGHGKYKLILQGRDSSEFFADTYEAMMLSAWANWPNCATAWADPSSWDKPITWRKVPYGVITDLYGGTTVYIHARICANSSIAAFGIPPGVVCCLCRRAGSCLVYELEDARYFDDIYCRPCAEESGYELLVVAQSGVPIYYKDVSK